MTIEQQIDAAIQRAKDISYIWADEFLTKESQGDSVCGEVKLFLLGQWMFILKDYKIYNFGSAGSITPEWTCVSLDEIRLLISKINAIQCN